MKQMSLIEMDGFLKGKCIPRDLKVNETNAEYLVRKFAELESKLETSLRECRSAGITIDNLEDKCAALAAENAGMKAAALAEIEVINRGGQAYCVKDGMSVNPIYARGWNDYRAKAMSVETPATDAFLAEVRAQARTDFIGSIEWIIRNECNPDKTETIINELQSFADQLRKGGNQ
ncbi:TPA: hNH endonuclease [Escherichia coli]|nr:hNH endonuclease [Escherichia coli]